LVVEHANPVYMNFLAMPTSRRMSQATTEVWREVIAELYDEEDEYNWTDQRGNVAKSLWAEDQQINFKLEP
jgi:hypothetical protein